MVHPLPSKPKTMKKMITELSLALLTTALFSQGERVEMPVLSTSQITANRVRYRKPAINKMAPNRNGAVILVPITGLTAVHVRYYRYLVGL